ncbi:MAG TPA: right-handed parallel beta-helix repeat-containing protein, partial [Planctomicrobium sp.]|nr:right-handed parallel beta-helix repeat-containing protein [Planctomicrobium sp.]
GKTVLAKPEPKRPVVNSPTRPADVATRSHQPVSHNPLGDFLSSLSDVDASQAKQPSSARQISDSTTMKLNRSETDSAPESETGHEDHFDLLPDDDDDNPFAVSREPSSIKTGPKSPSSKLSPSKSVKRKSPSAVSLEKIKSGIPPELLSAITKHRIPLAIGGGVLALLITVGLIYAFVGGGKTKPSASSPTPAITGTQTETTQSSGTPQTPVVQRPEVNGPIVTVGPKGNFGTLKEAIEYVRISGLSSLSTAVNEIQIEGKLVLNESLKIDNSGLGGFPRGIKIVGQSAEPPQLQPEGSDAAILLDSVEGLVIENLVVNCRGRSEGILVRGYSSSTSFINVTLENVQGTGLKGAGLSGLSGRPVLIQRCTFRAIAGTARGIHFDATSGSDVRHITVGQCRFLGPMAAGITVEGSGESIDFNQNLFNWNSSGILFSGADPILKKTRLVNNTFVGGDYGIRFDSSPSSSSNGFVFENNLFVKQANTAVSLPETKTKLTQGGSAQSNWTDGKVAEDSGLNIFQQNGVIGKEVEFLSDDASSPDFLKPKTPEVRSPNAPGTLKFFGAVSPQ